MDSPVEKLIEYSDEFYERHRFAFDESWTNLNYRQYIPQIKLVRAMQYYAPVRPEQETPLLIYENKKVFGTSFVGFLLTVHKFYYTLRETYLGEIQTGAIPLHDIKSMELLVNGQGLSNYNLIINGNQIANLILYPEEQAALNTYFAGIISGNFDLPEATEFAPARTRIVRDLLNPETGVLSLYALVKDETERLYNAILPLIESAWEEKLTDAVMHDLRVILHICGYADRTLDPREVFPFVYVAGRFANDHEALMVFETLQGMPNEQAEAVVCSLADSFTEWVHEVSHDTVFQLPPLLHRWDRRHRTDSFGTVAQAIYRFANVYVKADGMVKPEEEEALQRVWDLLHVKNRVD
jgi:hypothetical protein